jgi:hypothetical protein
MKESLVSGEDDPTLSFQLGFFASSPSSCRFIFQGDTGKMLVLENNLIASLLPLIEFNS